MAASLIKGLGTALVTPFNHNALDLAALKKIVRYNLSNGVDFLVPLGTTGETSTLTDYECQQVLDTVLEANTDGKPVIVGWFGKNNTQLVLDLLGKISLAGVHSILVASPYYNKPSQAGLIRHFTAIADQSPRPVILYNVPSRTAVNINAETTLQLAEHPNIIGTKEASGDFNQIMQILKYRPDGFSLLSGDDVITLPMIACGAEGVISVISNVFPRIFSDMVNAALAGNLVKAKQQNDLLLDVHKWLYIEGNPVGIKAALNIKGWCSDEVRLPLYPMNEQHLEQLKQAIKSL